MCKNVNTQILLTGLLIAVSACGMEDNPYDLWYTKSKDTPDVTFNDRKALVIEGTHELFLAITQPTDQQFFFKDSAVRGTFKKTDTQGSSVPNPFHDCGYRQLYDLTLHYLDANTSITYQGVGWKGGCE